MLSLSAPILQTSCDVVLTMNGPLWNSTQVFLKGHWFVLAKFTVLLAHTQIVYSFISFAPQWNKTKPIVSWDRPRRIDLMLQNQYDTKARAMLSGSFFLPALKTDWHVYTIQWRMNEWMNEYEWVNELCYKRLNSGSAIVTNLKIAH